MNAKQVVTIVRDAIEALDYQYHADHDGAVHIFPIINIKDDKVFVTTEENRMFEISIREIEE